MKKSQKEFYLNIADFSGGLNSNINPIFLQNQVPDAENVFFDDPVGVVRKADGYTALSNYGLANFLHPVKAIEFKRSTNEKYIVVCVFDTQINRYKIVYSEEGIKEWQNIPYTVSEYPYDMVVFEDVLWCVNMIDAPFVWNGLEKKVLDGQGYDWDGNKLANFKIPLGRPSGKFICVHQNRIVMANTIENGSEIIFSRFVDDDGNLVKATSEKAWININQIQINPDDGEDITAIYPYYENLCVFKQNSFYIVAGDLTNPTVIKIADKGCIDKNSICLWNNLLLFLSKDGVYAFNGREITCVSESIEDLIKDKIERFEETGFKIFRLSSYADFMQHYKSSMNLSILGTKLNSLSVPSSLILDNSEKFYAQPNVNENILFSDGIQLKYENLIVNYEILQSQGSLLGKLENIYDSNFDTYLGVYSRNSGSFNSSSNALIRIKATFSQQIYVRSFTIKYRIKSYTNAVGLGSRNGGIVMFMFKKDNGNFVSVDVKNVNQSSVAETITKTINDNLTSIEFYFTGNAWCSGVGYVESGVEIEIYEISFDTGAIRVGSGYYITQWIDTELYGERHPYIFTVEEMKPQGTNISYFYAYTDDNSIPITDDSITWIPISPNNIPYIPKRYYAFKVVLSTTNSYVSPVVKKFQQLWTAYGYYEGKKTLPQPVYWRRFYALYNPQDGNITFQVSKDGRNWTQINSGDKMPFLEPLDKIYFRVWMSIGSSNIPPQVFALFFTYSSTNIIPEYIPYDATEEENRYYIRIKDQIFVLGKNKSWTKLTIPVKCFVKNSVDFLAITDRVVRFDGKVYNSTCSLTTKTFVLGMPLESFLIRKIFLTFDSFSKTDTVITLQIYDKTTSSPLFSKQIIFEKNKNLTNPIEINCGIKVYQFFVKILNNTPNQDFRLVGLQFYIRPLRILSKEE